MKRLLALFGAALLLFGACGGDAAGSSSAARRNIGAGLTGPADLVATVYATGPANLASFAVDGEGRLWIGTASYTDDGTDTVSVTSGATVTTVLTAQHTVLGLLWVGEELFVSSTGRIDAYSGFDGTSFSSQRTVVELPEGVGLVGGMAQAPDGHVLVGIAAPCNACDLETEYVAAIVSFLPDGNDLHVYSSGIRAPTGLVFFPGSDVLFVTMNQRDDLGDATPGDWLAVVREGEWWGFPDCYGQAAIDCDATSEPLAELSAHAAASGVAIVTGQLGDAVGTAAIVAEWAMGKLLVASLDVSAPATASSAVDFVTGIAKPVALVVGADGALYAGDWASGTIYRIAAG